MSEQPKYKASITWTDSSGLTWHPAIEGEFTWQEALDKARELGLRLPTKKEFELAEKEGLRSKFNYIENQWWFWSSSPHPNDAGCAWGLSRSYGEVSGLDRNNEYSVRCVSRGEELHGVEWLKEWVEARRK